MSGEAQRRWSGKSWSAVKEEEDIRWSSHKVKQGGYRSKLTLREVGREVRAASALELGWTSALVGPMGFCICFPCCVSASLFFSTDLFILSVAYQHGRNDLRQAQGPMALHSLNMALASGTGLHSNEGENHATYGRSRILYE